MSSDKEPDTFAKKAVEAFETGDKETCLSFLQKLESVDRADGLKLKLNKALIIFKATQYLGTASYRDCVCGLMRDSHVIVEQPVTDLQSHGYLLYNYAVLLFHACQYRCASQVLQHLLDALLKQNGQKSKNRRLLREVCFLLTEISLLMYQGVKAMEYLMALEETCCIKPDSKDDKGSSSVGASSYEDKCRYRLQQYKIRCYLLHNSSKGYKKEIKVLSGFSQAQSYKQAFYKGEQECLRNNFRKAVKYIASIAPHDCPSYRDSGDSVLALVQNAFGCIYAKMNKPNLALTYFNKSLEEYAQAHGGLKQQVHSTTRPLYTVSQLWRYALLHNIGVTLLKVGQYEKAFDILVEVVQIFHSNPRIWLRIAEACIKHKKEDNSADFRISQRKGELLRSIIGVGPHRKLVLNFNGRKSGTKSSTGSADGSSVPVPTLEFASYCLRNALVLLATASAEVSASEDGGGSDKDGASGGLVAAPPGTMLSAREITNLKTSALCDSAYVAVCIGDYVFALDHVANLLNQPNLDNTRRMLGHLYAAEALLCLNRLNEAIDHLKPENLPPPENTSESVPGDPLGDRKDANWIAQSSAMALTFFCYNRAVILASKREYSKAIEELAKIPRDANARQVQVPIQAWMLSIYLQLQIGQFDNAYKLLKFHLPMLR